MEGLNNLGFSGGLEGKESACKAGGLDLIPGLGRSPEEGNGNSSILAWRIPQTEEPDGLLSMESQRVRHRGMVWGGRREGGSG